MVKAIFITNIASLSAYEGVVVYPNPNNGVFKITANSTVNAAIINSLVQIVYRGTINQGEQVINLGQYANGVYYVTIIQNDKLLHVKLIKE